MAAGQQGGSRRTAYRVGMGLGETLPVVGQRIHIRRLQIVGSESIHIQGSLVVSKENDNVGLVGGGDADGKSQG